MEVNQLQELKSLQEENRCLKQMYEDLAHDNTILRDVIEKSSNARGKKRNCNGDCRKVGQFGEGFWKIFQIFRRQGYPWNYKKVYRVYKSIHFEKRSRLKKRLPARVKNPQVTPEEPNTIWSIDFASDVVASGHKFRVMNIIDDVDRSIVAQEISVTK